MRRTGQLAILAFIGLAMLWAAIACDAREPKTLFEKKSQYSLVSVSDDEWGIRRLIFDDGATQSAIDTSDPKRLVLSYSRAVFCPLAVVPKPQRILIVGLGGGTMPMFLRRNYPDAQIDIAELDPVVVEAATGFFGFKEDARMKVHVGDGRRFIETAERRYDIIFLDAYGPDSIPYSLATRQFVAAVHSRLADGGIAVSNVWSHFSNKHYFSMIKTYQAVFDEVHVVQAPASENRIIIAMSRKQGLTKESLAKAAGEVQSKLTPTLDLSDMIRRGYEDTNRLPDFARVLLDSDEQQ